MRFPILAMVVSVALPAFGQTTFTVMVSGTSFQVDRYAPAGSGPFPVVALGHGFSNNKNNVRGLAEALMADGVVVVAPQFPLASGDHARNAQAMLAAIDATVTSGLGDAQRIGIGGHSAGALSAWLAASMRSDIRAVALLDPVDSNAAGSAVTTTAPVLFAFAPPQTCNTSNNSVGWFTAKQGPKGRFNVPMANHCDPQEPVNALCTGGCGPSIIQPATWNMARSLVFKHYARALFGQFLLGRQPCVDTMTIGDTSIDQVTMMLGCSVPDAGSGAGGGSAGGAATAGGIPAAGGMATAGGVATAGGTASAGGVATAGGTAGGAVSAGGTSGPTACTAQTCGGCCNGTVCITETNSMTCGRLGAQCAICRADETCDTGECAVPRGCGCHEASPWAIALAALGVFALRRRASA